MTHPTIVFSPGSIRVARRQDSKSSGFSLAEMSGVTVYRSFLWKPSNCYIPGIAMMQARGIPESF